MARFKPWLKMWGSWMSDPNLAKLNLGQRGAWWSLYTVAHNCDAGGRLVDDNGKPLSIDDIRDACNIHEPGDALVFRNMVKKMLSAGSLAWDEGALTITHYAEEQESTTTGTSLKGTKEAARERVRRFRERQKQDQLPLPLEPYPPKDKESTVSSNNKDNTTLEESVTELHPLQKTGVSKLGVTDSPYQKGRDRGGIEAGYSGDRPPGETEHPLQDDPVIAEIAQLYEKNIGQLPQGGVVIEDMIEFAGRFTGDIRWIKLAFKEALGRNKRQWRYIQTILERWQEEGGPDGRAAKELERSQQRGKGERLGSDKGHPAEAKPGEGQSGDWRKEWKVKKSGPDSDEAGDDKR